MHVVGWSLGGIFALLAAAADPDLPIASLTVVGSPVDVSQVPLVAPLRPLAHLGRRPGPDHPGLPGPRRGPPAAGQVGLPAVVVPEARHQAGRQGDPLRRRRVPRPDGGRRPVHRRHDRLPRPHLRPALPPVRQGQRARRRHLRPGRGDRRRGRPGPHDVLRRHHRPRAGLRRRHRRHRAGRRGQGRRPAAHRLGRGAVRDRPRRPPRHAHRPRRAHDDLGGARRVDVAVVRRRVRRRGRPRGRPRGRHPGDDPTPPIGTGRRRHGSAASRSLSR